MVESADQEGGFNIVGYTCNTRFEFKDVFYNNEIGFTPRMEVISH